MQIPVLPTQAYTSTPSESKSIVIAPRAATDPTTTASPAATTVKLGALAEVTAVYEKPRVYITRLRDQSQAGIAAMQTSRHLATELENLRNAKTTFSTSTFFSQVDALSRETSSYRNEARSYRVPAELATDKFSPDFSKSVGKRYETATLSIRTRDGDTIDITLARTRGAEGDALEFSFMVEGKLSEEEHQALAALTQKLGQVGDTFFRNGTAPLQGLKDIDIDVISNFNVTLSKPKGDSYVEQTYHFTVDEIAQTQQLKARDANGYSVDIKMHLRGLVDSSASDIAMMQQYLDLINTSAEESKIPNESKRFMLDTFASVIGNELRLATAPGDTAKIPIGAFDSGLPDFTATFVAPVVHSLSNYSEVSSMVLTIEQKTNVEHDGETLLLKQESHYSLRSSNWYGLPGMEKADAGNYLYRTLERTGNISRFLEIDKDKVSNLVVEKTLDEKVTEKFYQNYRLQDTHTRTREDRQLNEFSAQLKEWYNNKEFAQVNRLLAESHATLFLPHQ